MLWSFWVTSRKFQLIRGIIMLSQAYAQGREHQLICGLCLLTLQPRQGNILMEKQSWSAVCTGTRARLGTISKMLAWWPELSPLACIHGDKSAFFHSTIWSSFTELTWKKRLLGHGIAKATLNSCDGWNRLNGIQRERQPGTFQEMHFSPLLCPLFLPMPYKGKTKLSCFSMPFLGRDMKGKRTL